MAIEFGLVDRAPPVDLLREMALGLQQRRAFEDDARQQQFRAASQSAITPEGRVDMEAMRRAYAQVGDVGALQEMEQRQASALAAQQEAARKNAVPLARMIAGVTDEATYQRARAVAGSLGIDTSFMPPNYTPEAVAMANDVLRGLMEPAEQPAPTTMQRNYEFLRGIKPELGEQYVANQANPVRYLPDGMGGYTPVSPGGGIPSARTGGPPAAAIEALRRGEGTPEQFDQQFGQGAAARAMGNGGPASAPGGFPG